jgi:hypothetical protein
LRKIDIKHPLKKEFRILAGEIIQLLFFSISLSRRTLSLNEWDRKNKLLEIKFFPVK